MKVMKSNNVKLIDSPDQISDFILKFRGGSEEFSEQKLEEIVRSIPSDDKLIKSILSKIPDSNHSIISINKILKKIVKVIDPVVTNLRLWQVLGYQKSITVNVNAPQQTQSSILVNALVTTTSTLSPIQKQVQIDLKRAKGQPTLSSTMLEMTKKPTEKKMNNFFRRGKNQTRNYSILK